MIMPYDPRKPYLSGEQYLEHPTYLSAELAQRVAGDVRTLCRALGYDLNTVEFAIKGDVPYAIDFMNPAPDAERASVGEFYHNWVTNTLTDLILRRLSEAQGTPRYRWDALLNSASTEGLTGAAQPLAAAASAAQSGAQQVTDSILPQSVRELPSELAATVSDLVGQATGVVSEIVGTVADAVSPEPDAARGKRKGSAPSSGGAAAKKPAAKKATPARTKKPTSPGA
jgi:hypothetical protein